MIKCPECGRQISDKAPFCPNCGVAIAGKITKCPQCGEIYFKDQEMCPNCHHLTRLSGQVGNTASIQFSEPAQPQPSQPSFSAEPAQQEQPARPSQTSRPTPPPASPKRSTPTPPVPPVNNNGGNGGHVPPRNNAKPQQPAKKKNLTAIIVAVILATIVCAGCFYFYNSAKASKEEEAYEFAMKSDDPLVLQTYLDNYQDAPADHIDAVTARLEGLKQNDTDWNNAVVSGSKQALLDYLAKHPDTEHKAEIQHKVDSIDWAVAQSMNTAAALQTYLNQHANGEHVDEANDALKQLKAKTVQPEEKVLVTSVLRHFFQAVNSNDEGALEATVAPLMTNFLGKPDATKADVAVFLEKIYKDDITNMNWHLGKDMKIDKKEVGDEQYEYTASFSASQDIERTDPTKEKHANYKITAKVGPDGLISSMSMVKILQ